MDSVQGSRHERRSRSGLRAVAGLITLVAVFALGAAPAGAILYRVHRNHYLSYERIQGKPAPSNVTPSNAEQANSLSPTGQHGEIFSDTLGYLNYSGGPVMPSSKNFVVNWDPGTFPVGSANGYGTGGTCGFDAGSPCTGYVQGVNTFFQDLGTASQSNSPSTDQVATQYIANGGAPNYSVSSGGILQDNDPYPASGCPGAPSGGICLTDQQLQTELQSFLAANGEPNGLSNEYVLLTPPGVATCFDSGGQACSGNAGPGGKQVFCAYHSRTGTAGQYIYSNIPDTDNIAGCDSFSSTSPGGNGECDPNASFDTCIWPNGWGDGVLSAVSHEHNESITDPEPNNGWADFSQLRNMPGDENGDKCNFDAMDDPDTVVHVDWSNGFGNNVTPYNQTLNGRRYLVQMQWSNENFDCIDHYAGPPAAPNASFSVSSSGTTANFTATPGAAQYVWQFNDDVKPGDSPQQFTVTTTSPTISHAFPQLGTFTVALTAMSSTGLSQASSQNVTLTNPPPPVPPNTKITKFKLKAKKRKAKFRFTGSGGSGALSFQCELKGRVKWTKCRSPISVVHLTKNKRYTFEVRAIDATGQKDPTPAKKSFRL